ncbi:hypothetical protein LMG8520_0397 [Lactococcus lactis subsp. lactis]|uniref:Uncharacterized protein n=2 Tax=Lactococcus lactis TaxID=1358 RepID=A0A2A5SCE9_LACLH|nr:hypothetical protein [Lactococcus lactis]KSU13938.1 hypothetical protein LMG8520_0397 [Lactococcus lactis subsp. lactis]PCS11101.1 hypothetical protein RU90_GL001007 [Lactococcus lactis subsp. hordniae]
MKKKLFIVSILLLSVFLSGCSQAKNTDNKFKNTSQTKATSNSINYLNKNYTVKAPTSKIVTASFESMEDAVALNFHPIGAVTISGEMP